MDLSSGWSSPFLILRITLKVPVPIFRLTRPLNKKFIWIGSLVTLLVGSALFPKVNILTNANDYFPKEEMVKEDLQDISKTFMGMCQF